MVKIISSMATRGLLADLALQWQKRSGIDVVTESMGGVDAAKKVHAGEAFDVVVLASDAIDKLITGGQVVAGSRIDLVQSRVAVAVKLGAALPDISSEGALRAAIVAAPSIGYSTGPSGAGLVQLFERWGLAQALQSRMVQAPPGVPVGVLVARGDVALGFQQLSELIHLGGITVLGELPEAVAISTTFSAAVCAASTQRDVLASLLAYMASPEVASVKQQHGMQAIHPSKS